MTACAASLVSVLPSQYTAETHWWFTNQGAADAGSAGRLNIAPDLAASEERRHASPEQSLENFRPESMRDSSYRKTLQFVECDKFAPANAGTPFTDIFRIPSSGCIRTEARIRHNHKECGQRCVRQAGPSKISCCFRCVSARFRSTRPSRVSLRLPPVKTSVARPEIPIQTRITGR